MNDHEIIREMISEAMAMAGSSLANHHVIHGVKMLLDTYRDKTTINGVLDYLDQVRRYADIAAAYLEEHRQS